MFQTDGIVAVANLGALTILHTVILYNTSYLVVLTGTLLLAALAFTAQSTFNNRDYILAFLTVIYLSLGAHKSSSICLQLLIVKVARIALSVLCFPVSPTLLVIAFTPALYAALADTHSLCFGIAQTESLDRLCTLFDSLTMRALLPSSIVATTNSCELVASFCVLMFGLVLPCTLGIKLGFIVPATGMISSAVDRWVWNIGHGVAWEVVSYFYIIWLLFSFVWGVVAPLSVSIS